ncbi:MULTISPECIES: helix-turn-helix domain-containing protein [Sphingobium]|uniref:helix-turn-helix domain-containing protein n=1 Tax=Sphingobium TaxID=165695 RepID=UPI0022B7165B|nr:MULTISPECIES: LuxR C-terminal-related transcriptional regulator [Sphingobium]
MPGTEKYNRLYFSLLAAGLGIWDYDIARGSLYCCRKWHEILGLDHHLHRIDSIESFKRFIHLEDVDQATLVDSNHLSFLIENDKRYHAEFRIVRPSGEVRWISSVACILDNGAGHLQAIGCIRDITEFETESCPSDQKHSFPGKYGPHRPPSGPFDDPGDVVLTGKERECLVWVSAGKTAWETAVIMDLSPRTIEFHLNKAIRKLNAANKVHAAVIAVRKKLI